MRDSEIEWSRPLTSQLQMTTRDAEGRIVKGKRTLTAPGSKKKAQRTSMRKRMTALNQEAEAVARVELERMTKTKMARQKQLQLTKQRLNVQLVSEDKQQGTDRDTKLKRMLGIAESLAKIQARGKTTASDQSVPQRKPFSLEVCDELGGRAATVEYTPGCAIYYGSTVALQAHHGRFLSLDSSRVCEASAAGHDPHARFTIWNLDNLNDTGTLRYGDAVWFQCGRHEILGSSVMMMDVAAAWEREVRDYESRSHSTTAVGTKSTSVQSKGGAGKRAGAHQRHPIPRLRHCDELVLGDRRHLQVSTRVVVCY